MNTAAKIVVLVGALMALPAQAQNVGFFQNAIVARFDSRDMALLQTGLDDTLRDPRDGVARDWKNEKTGASGTMTAGKITTAGARPCRDVQVVNRYKNETAEGTFQFCQISEGAWKLAQ